MKQVIYRAALSLIPPHIESVHGAGFCGEAEQELTGILRRHRCLGGVLRLFDQDGRLIAYRFGMAGEGRSARDDTVFRVASVSKMITAMCVLKLAERGLISLDEDTGLLPYPVTLRQLMSHTAGIVDGSAYLEGLGKGSELSDVLSNSTSESMRGRWAYSNLGGGAIACVLEKKLGESFEGIMQLYLFGPLGVTATFYPQRAQGELADARRVLPPQRKPGFDARARKLRKDDTIDIPDPQHHYGLAQGNCCLNAAQLQQLMKALMEEGYLSRQSLDTMRAPIAEFGRGRQRLRQGLGVFGLQDQKIYKGQLYGHQGKAYGAVHAAFFEPDSRRGMIFLSSGISEAREGFLADAVCDLLRFAFREDTWA